MPSLTPTHAIIPLTTARARLFELAQDLLSGTTLRVTLTLRDHAESLLLIRASVVSAMEAELAELRSRVGPAVKPLRGLGQAHRPVEDVLRDVRAQQAALSAVKQNRLYAPIELPAKRVAERRNPRD